MKKIKAFERDIVRYVTKKCNYLLVPSDIVHEGDELVIETGEGEYFVHVTDVAVAARFSTCQISILTVDRFEVVK